MDHHSIPEQKTIFVCMYKVKNFSGLSKLSYTVLGINHYYGEMCLAKGQDSAQVGSEPIASINTFTSTDDCLVVLQAVTVAVLWVYCMSRIIDESSEGR